MSRKINLNLSDMETKVKKYRDSQGRRVVEVGDLSYLGDRNHGYTWFQLHRLHHTTGWAVRKADIIIVPNETVAKDVVKYYLVPKEKVVIDSEIK